MAAVFTADLVLVYCSACRTVSGLDDFGCAGLRSDSAEGAVAEKPAVADAAQSPGPPKNERQILL